MKKKSNKKIKKILEHTKKKVDVFSFVRKFFLFFIPLFVGLFIRVSIASAGNAKSRDSLIPTISSTSVRGSSKNIQPSSYSPDFSSRGPSPRKLGRFLSSKGMKSQTPTKDLTVGGSRFALWGNIAPLRGESRFVLHATTTIKRTDFSGDDGDTPKDNFERMLDVFQKPNISVFTKTLKNLYKENE